jgi:hypothetical protein
LQQPRDRATGDLPAGFCHRYRGPKIALAAHLLDFGVELIDQRGDRFERGPAWI